MKGKPPFVSLKRIKKAVPMSDFIVEDFDYIDFIKSEDDVKLVERLRELVPQLRGVPPKDCLPQIIEYTQIDRKLRGLEPAVFIHLPKDPTLN